MGSGMVDLKLEAVVLPVTDVDRAKAFYLGLGWRLDADFPVAADYRIVQFTPPNSPASVHFGIGMTKAAPGSAQNTLLTVDNVAAARAELVSRGADVSEIFHGAGQDPDRRLPGPDPDQGSYKSFATFADPDGNTWLLQEITQRLPGRLWPTDVGALAELLHETADHHAAFENAAPKHDWWDWYAAYLDARERGSSSEEAAAAAGTYMAEVKHIVV
jgi:catechol 2,3-dioxygenase-like lactoylglutathione lyase family enzyme